MADRLLYLKLNLGQNTVYELTNKTEAKSSSVVGCLHRRYDMNNEIYLKRKPDDNTINVMIYDKATDLINTTRFTYVIQIFLEKIEED